MSSGVPVEFGQGRGDGGEDGAADFDRVAAVRRRRSRSGTSSGHPLRDVSEPCPARGPWASLPPCAVDDWTGHPPATATSRGVPVACGGDGAWDADGAETDVAPRRGVGPAAARSHHRSLAGADVPPRRPTVLYQSLRGSMMGACRPPAGDAACPPLCSDPSREDGGWGAAAPQCPSLDGEDAAAAEHDGTTDDSHDRERWGRARKRRCWARACSCAAVLLVLLLVPVGGYFFYAGGWATRLRDGVLDALAPEGGENVTDGDGSAASAGSGDGASAERLPANATPPVDGGVVRVPAPAASSGAPSSGPSSAPTRGAPPSAAPSAAPSCDAAAPRGGVDRCVASDASDPTRFASRPVPRDCQEYVCVAYCVDCAAAAEAAGPDDPDGDPAACTREERAARKQRSRHAAVPRGALGAYAAGYQNFSFAWCGTGDCNRVDACTGLPVPLPTNASGDVRVPDAAPTGGEDADGDARADNATVAAADPDAPSAPYVLSRLVESSSPVLSRFGFAVAASGDGALVAVGAKDAAHEVTREATGAVYLYARAAVAAPGAVPARSWSLRQALYGAAPRDEFGNAVALSRDGRRLAVGSRSADRQGGGLRVYQRGTGAAASVDGEDAWDVGAASASNASEAGALANATTGTMDVNGTFHDRHAQWSLMEDGVVSGSSPGARAGESTLINFLVRMAGRSFASRDDWLLTEKHDETSTRCLRSRCRRLGR